MGGVTMLLAGDFRQILPIIRRGTRADQVNACLKASPLWGKIEKMTLHTNMRVHLHQDSGAEHFSRLLLQSGDGQIKTDSDDGLITLPDKFGTVVKTQAEPIDCVFPELMINYTLTGWLSERAILAPRNDVV
jgi:ATP-dependent DNA helicase PIF1